MSQVRPIQQLCRPLLKGGFRLAKPTDKHQKTTVWHAAQINIASLTLLGLLG